MKTEKVFTPRKRAAWYRNLRKKLPVRCNGYAMRLAETDKGPEAQAYFAMQPWALGVKKLHLLAAGGIRVLPYLIYMSDLGVYDQLTADAKSHTIDATGRKNLKLRMPDERGVPRGIDIGRDRLKLEKLHEPCRCPICLHMETEAGTTFRDLVEANNGAGNSDNGEVLRIWIQSHNIYVVEKYIEKLRVLVKDRDTFIEFLQAGEIFDWSLRAIEVVDKLYAAGPAAFEANIHLAYDRRKSSEGASSAH